MERMEKMEKKNLLEKILKDRELKRFLRDFLKMYITKKIDRVTVLNEEEKYKCPICGKEFNTLDDLEIHLILTMVKLLELMIVVFGKNTKKNRDVLRKIDKLREQLMRYVSSG